MSFSRSYPAVAVSVTRAVAPGWWLMAGHLPAAFGVALSDLPIAVSGFLLGGVAVSFAAASYQFVSGQGPRQRLAIRSDGERWWLAETDRGWRIAALDRRRCRCLWGLLLAWRLPGHQRYSFLPSNNKEKQGYRRILMYFTLTCVNDGS